MTEEPLSVEEANEKFKADVEKFLKIYIDDPAKAKAIYHESNLIQNITVEDLESGRINGLNSTMRLMLLEEYKEKIASLKFLALFHPNPPEQTTDQLQTFVTYIQRYPMIKDYP